MDYGKEFFEIMGKIHKLTNQTRLKGKIPKSEFMMLSVISCHIKKQNKLNNIENGIKISELSELLATSKPATSKMLSILEEKEYITRIMDKKDRRVVYVRLTEAGVKVLEETQSIFSQFTNQLFEKLGEEDASELIRIFNKLYQIISEELTNRKGNNND